MLEAAIEAGCCKYAVKRGCIPVKLQGGVTGTPDRLFLLPGGKTLLVEFKSPTGRLSPRQKLVHATYATRGHRVHVVRDTTAFKLLLDVLA